MKRNIFTSIDLELNQPSNSIIQIGAVVGDIYSGEILDSLSIIVNPNEVLGSCNDIEKTITELTGITQDQVDNGENLEQAYFKLKDFHKKYNSFINPITWGGGDSILLLNQLREKYDTDKYSDYWCFGRRWIDAKTLYISYRLSQGKDAAGGLAKAMTKFNLRFEGKKHNALDDAKNTFILYKHMLELFKKDINNVST